MNKTYTSTSEKKKYPSVCYHAVQDDTIFNSFKYAYCAITSATFFPISARESTT